MMSNDVERSNKMGTLDLSVEITGDPDKSFFSGVEGEEVT